jgi:hypothetical protein
VPLRGMNGGNLLDNRKRLFTEFIPQYCLT